MWIKLNEQEQRLMDYLMVIPPALEGAEQMLSEEALSPASVTRVGLYYTEECFCDAWKGEDYPPDLFQNGILPGRHSSYLYQVIEMLLRFGLDPNGIHEDMSMLYELRFVDNEYVAADTMVLLLEHGADPNLKVCEASAFEDIDFDVFFDTLNQRIRHRFDSVVHCWMVLLGFGGKYSNPKVPIQLYKEFDTEEVFDLRKLRDHRNYYVGLSKENGEIDIHIYDRRTFWEVARF